MNKQKYTLIRYIKYIVWVLEFLPIIVAWFVVPELVKWALPNKALIQLILVFPLFFLFIRFYWHLVVIPFNNMCGFKNDLKIIDLTTEEFINSSIERKEKILALLKKYGIYAEMEVKKYTYWIFTLDQDHIITFVDKGTTCSYIENENIPISKEMQLAIYFIVRKVEADKVPSKLSKIKEMLAHKNEVHKNKKNLSKKFFEK
ncbi:MAG: hypothetical protein ACK5KR_01615 [Breznakia sp.]